MPTIAFLNALIQVTVALEKQHIYADIEFDTKATCKIHPLLVNQRETQLLRMTFKYVFMRSSSYYSASVESASPAFYSMTNTNRKTYKVLPKDIKCLILDSKISLLDYTYCDNQLL